MKIDFICSVTSVAALAFLLICGIPACGQAPATEAVGREVERLLPSGTYTVAIMDSLSMDKQTAALMLRFQKLMQEHPDWAEAMRRAPKPAKMDARFGFSQAEEEQIKTSSSRMRVASTGSESVKVTTSGGTVRFIGTGRLTFMNEVWIDLAHNEAHMVDYTLPFKKTIEVSDASNAYGSAWKAYEWKYLNIPEEKLDKMSIDQMKKSDITLCEVQVGELMPTGQMFLKLKMTVLKKGIKQVGTEVPLFFSKQ